VSLRLQANRRRQTAKPASDNDNLHKKNKNHGGTRNNGHLQFVKFRVRRRLSHINNTLNAMRAEKDFCKSIRRLNFQLKTII
jgi:hypothetical protein